MTLARGRCKMDSILQLTKPSSLIDPLLGEEKAQTQDLACRGFICSTLHLSARRKFGERFE